MSTPGAIVCGHCRCEFIGSQRMVKRARYEKDRKQFCSPICRKAGRKRKPVPTHGPCPTCGQMFESRRSKLFCSLKCYTTSDRFQNIINERADRQRGQKNPHARPAKTFNCLECGKEGKDTGDRKYCSRACYRLYLSKRFDRWIASPETLALPQAYDEFLTKDELPCLVPGCGWTGHFLAIHMNVSHGVPKDEFKRAAGFNLKTGVVSLPLHRTLCERDPRIIEPNIDHYRKVHQQRTEGKAPKVTSYRSLEGREHAAKAVAMNRGRPGPERSCRGCGKTFQMSLQGKNHLYCTVACRNTHYHERLSERSEELECVQCGHAFLANHYQRKRAAKGMPVTCSLSCKGSYAVAVKFGRAS